MFPKVHHSLHNSPSLVCIPSQTKTIFYPNKIFKVHFIIIFARTPCLRGSFFIKQHWEGHVRSSGCLVKAAFFTSNGKYIGCLSLTYATNKGKKKIKLRYKYCIKRGKT
jgi:hypothetical protein